MKLAKVGADGIIKEMKDPKKATWKYLSISGCKESWEHCPEETKQSLLNCYCVDDLAESSLGASTYELIRYGRIPIEWASSVADLRRNKFLSRGVGKAKKRGKTVKEKKGIFHQMDSWLSECIVEVSIQDAPLAREYNKEARDIQRKVKLEKEKLIEADGLKKATETGVTALYYHRAWHSEACIRDVTAVTKLLRQYEKGEMSKSAIEQIFKENIRMRTKGMNWDKNCETDFHIPWS